MAKRCCRIYDFLIIDATAPTFELDGEKDGQILVELNITNEKTPEETPSVPQTGDNPGRPLAALALCIAAAGAFVGITIYRKKKENVEDAAKGQERDEAKEKLE